MRAGEGDTPLTTANSLPSRAHSRRPPSPRPQPYIMQNSCPSFRLFTHHAATPTQGNSSHRARPTLDVTPAEAGAHGTCPHSRSAHLAVSWVNASAGMTSNL